MVFQGPSIRAYVDNVQVGSVSNSGFASGMAGLWASEGATPTFDNLIIKPVGGATPPPTVFFQDNQSVALDRQSPAAALPGPGAKFNVTDGWFTLPANLAGRKAACTLFDLDGKSLGSSIITKGRIHIQEAFGVSRGSYVLSISK